MVNGRFPLSNSCGQLDMSYQDMHCQEEEAHMECPVKPEMEQYALTSALWFQAPGPFKCGPKSKFPTTGVSLASSHFSIVSSQNILTLTFYSIVLGL